MSEAFKDKTCEKRMWQRWNHKFCGNAAKMCHEGKYYCGLHNPVAKKARQEAKDKAFNESMAHIRKERESRERKDKRVQEIIECFRDIVADSCAYEDLIAEYDALTDRKSAQEDKK